MTETPPEVEAAAAPPPPATEPVADTWLTTGDHKRLGRLSLALAFVFLAATGVMGAILSVERIDPHLDVLTSAAFGEARSFHAVSGLFLFLLPAWVGLTTYVVPLQVGAPNVALPRASALAVWGHLVGGAIFIGATLAGGGFPGPGDADADELWILGLGLVIAAIIAGTASVVATALAYRAPGMTMRRAPVFTWSAVIGGFLLIVTLPVALAGLGVGWVDLTNGGAYWNGEFLRAIGWLFSPPAVYVFAVPALGAITEILATSCRTRAGAWPVTIAGIAVFGVLGFGAWVAAANFAGVPVAGDFLFQAQGLAIVAPTLLLLAAWADIVRRATSVRLTTALLFAVGAAAATVIGGGAGAIASVDRLDLLGTAWMTGQYHAVTLGVATLGLFAGIAYWAPKIWGAALSEILGRLAFAAMFLGVALLVLPDFVAGADDMPSFTDPNLAMDQLWQWTSALTVVGGLLVIGGAGLFALALLGLVPRRRREPAPDDPWGGATLEWATSSPPPSGNFVALPPITSDAPLLDAASTAEEDS